MSKLPFNVVPVPHVAPSMHSATIAHVPTAASPSTASPSEPDQPGAQLNISAQVPAQLTEPPSDVNAFSGLFDNLLSPEALAPSSNPHPHFDAVANEQENQAQRTSELNSVVTARANAEAWERYVEACKVRRAAEVEAKRVMRAEIAGIRKELADFKAACEVRIAEAKKRAEEAPGPVPVFHRADSVASSK